MSRTVVSESQPVGAPIVGAAGFIHLAGLGDVFKGPLADYSPEALPKQDHCRACVGGCVNVSGSEHDRTAGGCRPRYITPEGVSVGDVQMAFVGMIPVGKVPCLNGGPFRSTTKFGF